MRKSRLFMSAAAACLAGTMAVTGFAATEHWNDNSGKKAISDEWSQWKTKWETIKTDYEKVSGAGCGCNKDELCMVFKESR